MARKTFISLEDGSDRPGFWVIDRFLEVYLRFLLQHLENSPEADSPSHAIREQWHLASTGYFGGFVPHGFEEAVGTPEGERITLAAIHSLTAALKNAPEKLSKDVINLLWQDQYIVWDEDVETSGLVQISEALIALIEGRITTTAEEADLVPRPI